MSSSIINDGSSREENGDHTDHHRTNDTNDDDNHHQNDAEAVEERSLSLQVLDQQHQQPNTTNVRHTNIPILTCAFLAALTTGATSYSFGLYAGDLKKTLQLTQSQLDTLSSATFVSGIFSWIPGLIVDKLGTRTGTVSGGILGAVSLCCYWGVATKFFAVERALLVPILSFLGVLIFLACALITGSVFKIIVSTCGAGSKGTAVGAAKGYVGLGSGVYACLFESLKSKNQSDLDFLPMAAFFFIVNVTIPCLLLMPSHKTVQEAEFHDEATPLHFRTLFGSLLAMATIIIVSSFKEIFSDDKVEDADKEQNIPLALFLLTIWVGPILALQLLPKKSSLPPLLLSEETSEQEEGESLLLGNGDLNTENGEISLQRIKQPGSGSSSNNNSFRAPVGHAVEVEHDLLRMPENPEDRDDNTPETHDDGLGGERNLYQMLQTPTAILFLWTTTILAGGGIVMTNNMGQMVESLHFPKRLTAATMSFYSVAQSGGRVITGALSESALNWPTKRFCIDRGIPRPFFLVLASIMGLIAHLSLAVATSKGFFVLGATLAGLAFGSIWPLMVLIIGEVFGTANVGANYMFFDGFVSAVGSVLLSKFVAQSVYEEHIDKSKDPNNVTCLGSACFSMTHVVVAILSMTCIFTSMCMLHTTRRVYNSPNLQKEH